MFGDVMKIKNESKWDTKDLVRVIKLVCKNVGTCPRFIKVVQARNYGGTAFRLSNLIELRVPKTTLKCYGMNANEIIDVIDSNFREEPQPFAVREFSQILTHELHHLQGLNHEDMVNHWNIDVSYTDGMTVSPRKDKPKVPRDLKTERRQHVDELIMDKELKVKRLQNQLKKLYKRKKYYESRGCTK